MPSFTAAARSLAFAVAAFGTVVAAAQSAPKPAVPAAAADPAQSAATPTTTVSFDRQSVEISPAGRSALDTLAQLLKAQAVHQVELNGFATGDDADEARKLALVRTLAVRMYLIEQGVRARIEVAAQPAPVKGGGAKERVDVVTP